MKTWWNTDIEAILKLEFGGDVSLIGSFGHPDLPYDRYVVVWNGQVVFECHIDAYRHNGARPNSEDMLNDIRACMRPEMVW